jgi:hypothetical protein
MGFGNNLVFQHLDRKQILLSLLYTSTALSTLDHPAPTPLIERLMSFEVSLLSANLYSQRSLTSSMAEAETLY